MMVWEEIEKVSDCAVYEALQYLRDGKPPVMWSFHPISQRNEHNCHSAAKVVTGAIILLLCAGVSWLFWLKASQ